MKIFHTINSPRGALKRLALGWAVSAAVLLGSGLAADAQLTYDFSDGLQAWTQINPTARAAWNSGGNGWGNTGSGCIYGYDADDFSTETYWVRSPEFCATNSGPLTVFLWGGGSAGPLAGNVADVPANSQDSGGFMGVGLREVATRNYVASIPRPGDGSAGTYSLGIMWCLQSNPEPINSKAHRFRPPIDGCSQSE
jgi:hypothetical protein